MAKKSLEEEVGAAIESMEEAEDEKKEGDPENIPEAPSGKSTSIPVASVTQVEKGNTRQEQEPEDEEFKGLCQSIALEGIVVPIIVVDKRNGTYKLLDGTRRLAAAKSLSMTVIPALVVEEGKQSTKVVSAIANLVRKDLNPIEEANAYKILMDECKLSTHKLSRMLGKSQAHVSQKLALLSASKKAQEKLAKGEATESAVRSEVQQKKEGKDPEVTLKIPKETLPDGIGIKVTNKIAAISLRFEIESEKNVAVSIQKGSVKLLKSLDQKMVNGAYKAAKKEAEK